MCGNDNYCEIVCQLFQAPVLLMESAMLCCETGTILIHVQELIFGARRGGGSYLEYLVSYISPCECGVLHNWTLLVPPLARVPAAERDNLYSKRFFFTVLISSILTYLHSAAVATLLQKSVHV
jgi:hypothetical protein